MEIRKPALVSEAKTIEISQLLPPDPVQFEILAASVRTDDEGCILRAHTHCDRVIDLRLSPVVMSALIADMAETRPAQRTNSAHPPAKKRRRVYARRNRRKSA